MVANEFEKNIHVHEEITESEFVENRQIKDFNIGMPKLILPLLQVNIRAGHLPT